MAIDLDELRLAYELQNQVHDLDDGSWLDLEAGTLITHIGENPDLFPPLPADIETNPRYVPLPTRQELNLGRELALDFMAERRPDEVRWTRETLGRRGGWHRFKNHLEDIGLIRDWYDYQEQHTLQALKAWCESQGVEVVEKN